MKISVLDRALCCSTGVCGNDVDDALVQISANVKWLKSLGHEVNRHNISNDASSFKQYAEAIDKLQRDGIDSLPYILVNDRLAMSGRYPEKAEWEKLILKFGDAKKNFTVAHTSVDCSCSSGEKCC